MPALLTNMLCLTMSIGIFFFFKSEMALIKIWTVFHLTSSRSFMTQHHHTYKILIPSTVQFIFNLIRYKTRRCGRTQPRLYNFYSDHVTRVHESRKSIKVGVSRLSIQYIPNKTTDSTQQQNVPDRVCDDAECGYTDNRRFLLLEPGRIEGNHGNIGSSFYWIRT